jgi:hypothetical protein
MDFYGTGSLYAYLYFPTRLVDRKAKWRCAFTISIIELHEVRNKRRKTHARQYD